MKLKRFLLITLVWAFTVNAFAITLSVGTGTTDANGKQVVPVNLTNLGDTPVASVSAAAFTVTFDTEKLVLESVESSFFAPFKDQFAAAKTDPVPEIPALQKSPLVWNKIEGTGAAIAGVRCAGGTNDAPLFQLVFSLKEGAEQHAFYPVGIRATRLNDTLAGYSKDGETIPLVMAADTSEDPATPAAYPAIFTMDTEGAVLAAGHVTFIPNFTDSDADGMDDNWEIQHFGDLEKAGKDTDTDGDGILDADEYRLQQNPADALPALVAASEAMVASSAATDITITCERLTAFSLASVSLVMGETSVVVPHKDVTETAMTLTLPKDLSVGTYTLSAVFKNGVADQTFTVKNTELTIEVYTPVAPPAPEEMPTEEALTAIEVPESGILTKAQLDSLGLTSLSGNNRILVQVNEDASGARRLTMKTDLGVLVQKGALPMETELSTAKDAPAGAMGIQVRMEKSASLTADDTPYSGVVNPPRPAVLSPERKKAIAALLESETVSVFTIGDEKKTIHLSQPAFVVLTMEAVDGNTPKLYYLDGTDQKKTLAGIDGSATYQGKSIDIKAGGTVLATTTGAGGKNILTIGLLLDHFSRYAVAWEKKEAGGNEEENSSDSCFIESLLQ